MKLLVSDFDDTIYFLNEKRKYLKNIEKIKEFVGAGNMFVIATGRSLETLKREIDSYDLPYSYLVCNDGAIIYDKNERIIFQNNLDEEITNELEDYLKSNPIFSQVAINNNYGTSLTFEDTINGIVATHNNYEEAVKVKEELLNKYDNIIIYTMYNVLCIRNKNVNKGKAINYLTNNHIKIDFNNIYITGDHVNDVSMFKIFNGYAVENAVPELLDVSKGVVKSVADLIDKIK